MAYYAAAIGIVRDAATGAQRHFGGHTREITCMSMCAAETTLDGVTYPPLTLAATGQRKAVEDTETDEAEVPFVCVWDTRTCREVAPFVSRNRRARRRPWVLPRRRRAHHGRLRRQPHRARVGLARARRRRTARARRRARGPHRSGRRVQRATDGRVRAPSGIRARPPDASDSARGAKTRQDVDRGPSHAPLVLARHVLRRVRRGGYPRRGVSETSAASRRRRRRSPRGSSSADAPTDRSSSGATGGRFDASAHARGPRTIQPDGTVAWGGGVRALRLRPDVGVLLTGGADGAVAQWDASDGALGERITEPVPLADPSTRSSTKGVSSLAIRAIDCASGSDVILVGTSSCGDAWTVNLHPESESTRVVVKGHASRVRHACWHPRRPDVFFTACESGEVCARDATRAETRVARVGLAASAIAVTRDAVDGASHHVAVAGTKGEIAVLDERTLEVLHATRAGRSCVEDLKYSPDGSRLAAAARGRDDALRRRRGGEGTPRVPSRRAARGTQRRRATRGLVRGLVRARHGRRGLRTAVLGREDGETDDGGAARRAVGGMDARVGVPGDGRVGAGERRHGRQRDARGSGRAAARHRGRSRRGEALRVSVRGGGRRVQILSRAREFRGVREIRARRRTRRHGGRAGRVRVSVQGGARRAEPRHAAAADATVVAPGRVGEELRIQRPGSGTRAGARANESTTRFPGRKNRWRIRRNPSRRRFRTRTGTTRGTETISSDEMEGAGRRDARVSARRVY